MKNEREILCARDVFFISRDSPYKSDMRGKTYAFTNKILKCYEIVGTRVFFLHRRKLIDERAVGSSGVTLFIREKLLFFLLSSARMAG